MYLTIPMRKRLREVKPIPPRDENGDSRFGALTGAKYWLPISVAAWILIVAVALALFR
jgi:hypothetical protein